MSSRRSFIQKSAAFGAASVVLPNLALGQSLGKAKNSSNDKLQIGIIGVGLRGTNHLENALKRQDVVVTAIADIDPNRIAIAQKIMAEAGAKAPLVFGKNELDYRNLLDLKTVDAVLIATPWLWHTRMSVDAMKAGKFAGVEVSAANTMEECWDLVNTHEQTGTHLMLLENVNYRRDVMAVLNMVKEGVFGEMLHYRCGYQHDLRAVKFNDGKQPYGGGVEFGEKAISEAKWRTQHSVTRNADVYPTHGLGPIAAMANINRGNRFVSMSSHATKAVGLHKYIVDKGGADHPNAAVRFKQGDIITSTLETAMGETIIITHDCNSPRPYSLGFRVQGSNGLWEKDGDRIYIEGQSEPHRWDASKAWLEKYDHPLWKKYGEYAEGAGHGGMDFFVLNAFVEAAKANVAPPIDAYDAAAWSAVTPLSELSIENNGAAQDFPDFTRGQWIKRTPYPWITNAY